MWGIILLSLWGIGALVFLYNVMSLIRSSICLWHMRKRDRNGVVADVYSWHTWWAWWAWWPVRMENGRWAWGRTVFRVLALSSRHRSPTVFDQGDWHYCEPFELAIGMWVQEQDFLGDKRWDFYDPRKHPDSYYYRG